TGGVGGNGNVDEKVVMEQILVEFTCLRRYAHDNILPLYAYSIGGEYPCLVYKLMGMGSLEDRLQCKPLWQRQVPTAPLNWKTRIKIALGVARGLQFLHNVHEKPLIHGDVKSGNILLDENYEPKIGDFGLAREGPDKGVSSMLASRIQGTRPYLPPEFLKGGRRSTKLDVYSFGIVLFELATGERAADKIKRPAQRFLGDWVKYHFRKGSIDEIIDARIPTPTEHELRIFRQLIDLGLRCANDDPKRRPEMKLIYDEIWQLIESFNENLNKHALTCDTEDVNFSLNQLVISFFFVFFLETSESEGEEESDMDTDYSRSHRLSIPSISVPKVNAGLPLLSFLLQETQSTSNQEGNSSPPPIPDFAALGIGPDVDTVKLGEALRPLVLLSQEDSPTARAVTALLPAITALFSNRSMSGSPLLSNEKTSRSRKSSNEARGGHPSFCLPAISALHGDERSELSSHQLPDLPMFKSSSSGAVPPRESSSSGNLPDISALNAAPYNRSRFLPVSVSEGNEVDGAIPSGVEASSQLDGDSDEDLVVPTAAKKKLAI
ncbi:hypothetical protein QYM36_001252, partial [Artemia franciscana]